MPERPFFDEIKVFKKLFLSCIICFEAFSGAVSRFAAICRKIAAFRAVKTKGGGVF